MDGCMDGLMEGRMHNCVCLCLCTVSVHISTCFQPSSSFHWKDEEISKGSLRVLNLDLPRPAQHRGMGGGGAVAGGGAAQAHLVGVDQGIK